MTTERMTGRPETRLRDLAGRVERGQADVVEHHQIARIVLEQAERIRQLEDMLRLANDKMAEQVRQARYDVAMEIYGAGGERVMNEVCSKIIDANAPKD